MAVYIENETSSEKISPVFERRIINLENLMIVVCDFTNGPAPKPDPPHSHPHEQITYVAEGDLFLKVFSYIPVNIINYFGLA